MKLIIDIPEDVYTECRGHIYFPDTGGELFNAVKNGTPLDDVKAEIREHCERYADGDIIADEVIQAVDNIGKAESEEP